MSASTVSITANPASATPRRRSLVTEKISNVEAVVVDPNANGINRMEDKTAAGAAAATAGLSRDLSHHSGRTEPSKDSMQARKVTVGQNSNGLPRRSRKVAVNKTEKPRWLTAVSIFGKNLAFLLVLVGLAQIIRRLTLKSEDVSVVGTEMGLTEFEGRVAEVESFLKTTANMIQVQVDVFDKKIENEIGGLKREMNERIEGQTALLEKLKKLEEKSEELGKSLSELKSADLLTKEEFEKMYEQMLKEKGENGKSENPVSLSDLGAYAREIVKNEIEKHASDGLGRVDYALSSGGGKVVRHSEPFLGGKGINWFLKSSQNGVHRDADKILKPSFGEPGQCFPLKGSSGFVQIKLRTAIIPEAVTLEHVAKSVAYDRSSAPKDCRVYGWQLQGGDPGFAVDSKKMFLLAEFTYDLEKSNAQTFDVLDTAGIGIVDTVRLDFSSNHGSASHTCIYRLRVHGHEPDSVSMVKTES
ncbi:protein ETHYLENE INSENSITIVE 3-like isoform 1 [Hibiscus syriacus]|uniref:Protein ETHYLENE INSENSITIVE 3-like isoform 1 n=1 Tax=Hibiscus syriacus TaxID=106335 RepID=A0A6A2ZDH4_HIBSY|nr:SUN domain-containing protein 1-like [Hibiscus syriacus]KAE8689560.1 protein ETHYLENE INSENSITIVE 3-like isoform 1 [Hibiscus syriacus]